MSSNDTNEKRKEDGPTGAHGDVVVAGEKAPFALRRSAIQVAELVYKDGTLSCNRDEPFDFWMPDVK